MKNLITLAVTLFAAEAMAQAGYQTPNIVPQPTKYSHQVCGLPLTVGYGSFRHIIAGMISDTCLTPPAGSVGYLNAGVAGSSRIDAEAGYSVAVGGYFYAEANGKIPARKYAEAVGVYAKVAPSIAQVWAVALHGECVSETNEDGLCIGVNIELRGAPNRPAGVVNKQRYIGINIQPGEDLRGVVGMQFQNIPGTDIYKHSIDVASTFIRLGTIDEVGFCMKFGGKSGREQLIEFWRGCGEPWATRTGFINMNFASPDIQLNQ
jgi:hypothetical protein